MKEFYKKYLHNYGFLCVITSLVLNLLIECFSRRSISAGFQYLVDNPVVFLYNSTIILLTLSIILIVKRRIFFYSLISIIWIAFGITNGIVLSNRVTPFTAIELKLLDSVLSIMDKYLTQFQIGLIIVGIVAIGIGLILAFIFAPKYKGKLSYKRNVPIFVLGIVSFTLLTNIAVKTEVVSTYFGNIAYAYLDYGFPYCFSNTLVNTGISKPDNYSEEAVKNIFADSVYSSKKGDISNVSILATNKGENQTSDVNKGATEETPNIIFLQLESFFDPTRVEGLEFSEDPVPYYRSLREQYSSGLLSVPSIGAGTANTEFEVISGMNLEFFGPGEYPYKTILKKKTVESINYDLKPLGYSTHAIHNNKGTFYTRQNVFKNLGFDSFTSVEFMNILEKTPLDWAKDKYLTGSIMDALNSTENKDFIYTISVQGHGDYPDYPVEGHSRITVSGIEDEGLRNSFQYYVNEINEMDNFVKDLVKTLENYDEDIVLVMYGDHLPSLGIEEENMKSGNPYETEYVIWSNFNMEKEDKDLEAYQLTSNVLNRFSIDNGTLIKYHQLYSNSPEYQENLKLLQYDMLYGKQYIYNGINPFEPTNMSMGVKPIYITSVFEQDNNIYVKGENFTDASRVIIDGSEEETVFIDNKTLMVEGESLEEGETDFKVYQVTVTDFPLYKSEEYIYRKEPIVEEN